MVIYIYISIYIHTRLYVSFRVRSFILCFSSVVSFGPVSGDFLLRSEEDCFVRDCVYLLCSSTVILARGFQRLLGEAGARSLPVQLAVVRIPGNTWSHGLPASRCVFLYG